MKPSTTAANWRYAFSSIFLQSAPRNRAPASTLP
jgi:hypothetical protein